MPRTARRNVHGVLHHIRWRFVDRSWFLTTPEERAVYLRMLGRALADSDWRCLAYALMSNHLHFAMIAGRQPMSSWARRVHAPFARWMNQHHQRLGPVMADRALDNAVLPHREHAVIAYIHNNPVRAGVVAHARDSAWTSHRAYVGLEPAPAWLYVELGMARCDARDGAAFDALVSGAAAQTAPLDLRDARKDLRRRGELEISTPAVDDADVLLQVAQHPYAHVRPHPARIIQIVAETAGTRPEQICSRQRRRELTEARALVVNAASACGLTQREIAAALGLSATAVLKLGRRPMAPAQLADLAIVNDRIAMERWAASRVS